MGNPTRRPESTRAQPPIYAIEETFSLADALTVMEGEMELLKEVAELFLEGVPGHLDKINTGFFADDLEAIRISAHSLRGSAASIAAHRFHRLNRELEMAADAGAMEQIRQLLPHLGPEFDLLKAALLAVDWVAPDRPV